MLLDPLGTSSVSASGAIGGITFTPGTGISTITTGAGADTLTAGSARAVFSSGNGADTLTGGAGNDNLTSGAGNDTISTGAGTDNVTAGAGTDTITLGTGAKTIYIAAGDSALTTSIDNSSVSGISVAGADVITGVNVGDIFVLQPPGTDFYGGTTTDNTSNALENGEIDNTSAILTASFNDNSLGLVRGVYSSGLFSQSTSGGDVLMAWDDNSSTSAGGETFRFVVLQGSTVDNASITIDGTTRVVTATIID
jgi:Ca2+-binding RTX toxin-like protein